MRLNLGLLIYRVGSMFIRISYAIAGRHCIWRERLHRRAVERARQRKEADIERFLEYIQVMSTDEASRFLDLWRCVQERMEEASDE